MSSMSSGCKTRTEWLTLIYVLIFCCFTGGRSDICSQSIVWWDTIEQPSPSPVTIADFKTFCPNVTSANIISGSDANCTVSSLAMTCTYLDAEAKDSNNQFLNPREIYVNVTDNMGQQYTLTVVITLASINDYPATAVNLKNTIPVPEDTPTGTRIGGCTLVDGDYPGYGHDIPYVEISQGNDENRFAIDNRTCDIYLVADLDYAQTKQYTLTLKAYNFFNDNASTTSTVTVTVGQVDKYPPICNPNNIIRPLPENTLASSILAELSCTQYDGGSSLNYFRGPTSYIPYLDVNQNNGKVFLNTTVQYDNIAANNMKQIVVEVTTLGSPKLTTSVPVTFFIQDVDDHRPQFSYPVFSTTIPVTTLVGTSVLRVIASDADAPNTANSKITYVKGTCNPDWLLLNSDTGVLYLREPLDLSVSSNIACTVSAYSSDQVANTSIANVSITIIPAGNRPPIFSQCVFQGSVQENAGSSINILTATASDPDNNTIQFSFTNAYGFQINSQTGVMSVGNARLDYENIKQYQGAILAADNGSPPMTTTVSAIINVLPVNEFDPIFNNVMSSHISRTAWPNTSVLRASATDADDGFDGEIKFSLKDTTVPFILEQTTGIIRVAVGLDRSSQTQYNLVVVATDQSLTAVRSSSATYTVFIDADTRNDPVCNPLGPLLVTPNNPSVAGAIGYLSCTDPNNVILRYDIIQDDSKLFVVDTFNGTIRLGTNPIAGTYFIVVQVSDRGSPPRTATVSVQINIQTSLKFYNLPNNAQVSEGASVTSLVFTVVANGSYELVTYRIVGGNTGSWFNLGQTSGELRLANMINREQTPGPLTLTIQASTASGLSIKNTLTVYITDINDNIPTYSSSYDLMTISESQPYPSPLKQYSATDQDLGDNATIIYGIVSGNVGNVFQYDSNGFLRLNSKLSYASNSYYTLILGATDRGTPALSSSMTVNIIVVPVSDSSLIIVPSGSTVSVSLPEDTTVGAAVITIGVQNNQTKSNLTFAIASGNNGNNFTINVRTGVIYLVYALDREASDMMQLVVTAADSNGNMNYTNINIMITDVNDNDPLFTPVDYVIYAPDHTPPGNSLGSVTVTDADIGVNKDVTITITNGDPGGMFAFNGNMLIANRVLDANSQSYYELQVTVTDHGSPSRNSTGYIILFVNPAQKKPYFFNRAPSVSVEETRAPGSLLFNLDATFLGALEKSTAQAIPGDLVYSLLSGNSSLFFVESDTGEVQLIGPLSYATATSYTLTVLAVNKYNSSLNDTSTLTIIITQVNRYPPVFSSDLYIWTVMETVSPQSVVGRVAATDRDPGQYGTFSYAMEQNPKFSIDSSSGIVTVNGPLEFYIDPSYGLFVTATDNAGPNSFTTYAVVVINVDDRNNHAPLFIYSPYTVNVPESLAINTVFGVLFAEDLDSGAFGNVTYSIVSGNGNGKFSIDPRSGDMWINSKLDFESRSQYVVEIQGADGGSPSLSGIGTMTINVMDQNDYAPNFGATSMSLTVRSDTAPMTSIYRISATDKDSGRNGVVDYVIASQSSDNLFEINTFSGDLSTAKSLESVSSFQTLIVHAIDEGLPSQTGTMPISITIQPILKPGPANYDFNVPENQKTGTTVGVIPNDPTLNNITNYIISGGNYGNAFGIVMNGNKDGVLQTASILDRESYPYYQLTIYVTYGQGSIRTLTAGITITDVNDNLPVFNKNPLRITMVQKLPPGNTVGTFTVTDADTGLNGQVDLAISSATPLGGIYFSVGSPGIIKVTRSVSYDVLASITFYVVATDRGTPKLSSTLVVIVNVVNYPETKKVQDFQTAFYDTCNFPDDVNEGDVVCEIGPSNVGVTLGNGDTVSYTTVGADSVFYAHPSKGYLLVQKRPYIYSSAKYFQWVIISVTSGGNTTTYALQVRLDTFNKNKNLMLIKYNTNQADLISKLSSVQATLQSFYNVPRKLSIWTTVSLTSTAGRRKLLAAESEVQAVVVADNSTDDMANAGVAKTFLSSQDAVAPLQASSDGTPKSALTTGSPSASSVTPYSNDDNSLDPAYIAAIVIGCIAGLVLLIALIFLIVYCACYRRKDRSDKKRLVEKKKKSKEAFGNINKSTSKENKDKQPSRRNPFRFFQRNKNAVNGEVPSDAPAADGMPKYPTTATFISSSMTPEAPYHKNSSTVLTSLEESAEDGGHSYNSYA